PTELARAVAYGELAARRAVEVFAYGEAERQLDRALQVQEILDQDDLTRRCDLLLQLSAAMLPTEEPERVARTAAANAFKLAQAGQDSSRAARAALLALEGLWRALGGPGGPGVNTPDGAEWVERADRHARAGTAERIYADMWKGIFHTSSGRVV